MKLGEYIYSMYAFTIFLLYNEAKIDIRTKNNETNTTHTTQFFLNANIGLSIQYMMNGWIYL